MEKVVKYKLSCKMNNRYKGISLILLVVTIVIILILCSAVIIGSIDNGNVIEEAHNVKDKYNIANDIDKIRIYMSENMFSENTVGLKLDVIRFNDVSITSSIYDSENGTTYSKGWYLLTPEHIPELKLSNSYIIDYDKGKVIVYDKNVHRIVTSDMLSIKDGLVYNADFKNMTKDETWGDAILHNFNIGDTNSGWSDKSLMFDGIDDGIEMNDNSNYSDGVTIEIYCRFRGATANQNVQILMMKRTNVNNGFFMFLGNKKNSATAEQQYGRLTVYIGGVSGRLSTNTYFKENEDIYVTYTFNPNANTEKGILYVNGVKKQTTSIGNVTNIVSLPKNTTIQIGSDVHVTMGGNNRYPFNGEIYAARVYNRPLTAQEVLYNYNNTVINTNNVIN